MTFLLCALSVVSVAAAQKPCSITATGGRWVLANQRLSVGVSQAGGAIDFIRDRNRDVLYKPAPIRITDKLSGLVFDDRNMHNTHSRADRGVLAIERQSGDYTVSTKYTIDPTSLRIDCTVFTKHTPAREVAIEFLFPIASQKFENVFWPMVGTPFNIRKPGVPKLAYRYGILVPETTVYNPITDLGISFIAPIGLRKPGFSFEWQGKYPENTLAASTFHLACGGGKTARASICIVAHEGDWRPGLGWMVKKYPEYFRAPNCGKLKGEGPMSILYSTTSDDWLKRYSEIGVKWLEYQYCFPFYGLYAPKSDTWSIIADSDRVSLEDWEKGVGAGAPFGKEKMRHKTELAHQNGISIYQYYQHADVWHQYADKYYAKDIAKDEKGDALPAFTLCRLMNSDPSTKWGRDIRQQARDMLSDYPDIDGILWDELFYVNYDFAHDDGISMQGTTPCYQLGFACEKLVSDLVPIIHGKGKSVWGNVPSSVEVIRGLDGILIESPDSYAETMQYLAIAKPMVLLAYDKDAKATEDKLKRCILFGAFPSLTEEQFPKGDEARQLEQRYGPMIDHFKGREWVLTAHPLTLPPTVRGNIFKTPSGLIVTVVSPEASELGDTKPQATRVPVTIRPADAAKTKRCHLLRSDGGPRVPVPMTRGKPGEITVTIPSHRVASMLVFGR